MVALAAVDLLASGVAERSYVDTLRRELWEKGRTLTTVPHELLLADFGKFARAANVRLTSVARNGRVIADSDNDAERMENHADRPELIAAFAGKEGSSVRPSPTMHVSFLYASVPTADGALRLAVPLSKITRQVNAIRRQMLAVTALAFLPSVLIAAFIARYISGRLGQIIEFAGRLAEGDFSARLNVHARDELGKLSGKLNDTGEKLQLIVQQLEREHAELEKVERVRKDFVINVSHELRTPLASIQGYTETLLDGAIDEPEHNRRFLNIIRQNTERLRRLTEDLLTLSRIELNRQHFQFAMQDVNALLEENADAMQPMALKKGVELKLETAQGGAHGWCDSEAIHQILTNLVDNALKYTPPGGAVTVGARPAKDGKILLYVRDTGVGIPKEDLPRLFERFYRVDKARSRELGGTGLGLAIVKHLVRAHLGEVRVESVAGQGSTFEFTVPAETPEPSEHGEVQPQFTA